jgi:MSHA biogenesis protein MshP
MFHKDKVSHTLISYYMYNLKCSPGQSQGGSALVIAIFVIIIMSLIGSALVRIQGSSAESIVYEVIGARAYAAAQSGIQWQLAEIFPLNTTGTTRCKTVISGPDLTTSKGLDFCAVAVSCNDTIITNEGVRFYTITSIGSCNVADIKTSRTIKIEARSL